MAFRLRDDATEGEIRAMARGCAARTLYAEEFDVRPTREDCGDWDSTAWGEDWVALKRECSESPDAELCLAAWRGGFFGH